MATASSAGCCWPTSRGRKPAPRSSNLRTLGLRRQVLLTGDRARVARRIGEALGIADIRAEALPEQKMERVLREVGGGLSARWSSATASTTAWR